VEDPHRCCHSSSHMHYLYRNYEMVGCFDGVA
jgi:hypothetical protein